jgi:hypothetical protein
MQIISYGIGGHDESLPNNNIISIEEIPDPEPTEQDIARAAAIAKLEALGLTESDLKAILG